MTHKASASYQNWARRMNNLKPPPYRDPKKLRLEAQRLKRMLREPNRPPLDSLSIRKDIEALEAQARELENV